MKRIAVIGKTGVDSLAWHIDFTLKKMNHQSAIFEPTGGFERKLLKNNTRFYLSKLSSKYENYIYRHLIEEISSFEPSLIIVILRSIPPYVIKEIKERFKIKVIFWSGDGLVNLERQYALISEYDAWFVKDRYMFDFMRSKLNLNVFLLPECFNPYVHKPPTNSIFGSEHNVSVVGTLYPYRASIIEQLISHNIEVDIFGSIPNWMGSKWADRHAHKYVTLDKKSDIFYKSKINLNTIFYGDIDAGNCRLFEVAGAGGFQICDRKKEITNYFRENEEIIFFDNTNELIEKTKYYLKNQDAAENIANNSYKRAINEHTYEHRINDIFRIIGFN